MMDEKTVVGFDGTAQSRQAVDWAVERERGRQGTVALVRVVDDTRTSEYRTIQTAVETAQAELNQEAARLKALAPECFITTTVVRGDPLDELLRQSNPRWVLAIAAERHRSPSFMYGWSLGARVAAAANGPVAIIPPVSGEGRAGVFVGVDGSPESLDAVELAAVEALRREDELVLVHAWEAPAILAEEYAVDSRLVGAVEAQGEQILTAASDMIAARYPQLRVRRQLIRGGAEHALRDCATTAALLILGTRHLRGLKRVLLGSVSHSVVINMLCPTIVVGQVSVDRVPAPAPVLVDNTHETV